MSSDVENAASTNLAGAQLIAAPPLNKGTAFSQAKRAELSLRFEDPADLRTSLALSGYVDAVLDTLESNWRLRRMARAWQHQARRLPRASDERKGHGPL